MAKLRFHGAAQEVTGSMHLLEMNGSLIALDCGLFQGRRAEAAAKNVSFPCDPADLDALILSHAHIDHCGRLPRLVKGGFDGPIYSTAATRDLAAVMLQDSAHIQSEDARYLNKKRAKKGEPPIEPLYEAEDARQALRLFTAHPYDRWFHVIDGIKARFFEAGHMLGSAGVLIEATESRGSSITLAFTGDVGRWGVPILRDPAPIPHCDYVISESTYGGRRSDPVVQMKPRLRQVVEDTVARGGKVIIPAFSVGRTQTLVYHLNQLFHENGLDVVPVFVDSPLAINATEVFTMHPDCYDRDATSFLHDAGNILDGPNVYFVRAASDSKKLNQRRKPAIIIAASGMCEAGRILHHLKHGVSDKKNTILIVGFQAAHTLGRRIVERADTVKVYGEKHKLKAQVVVLNGFSSHADAGELRRHLAPHATRCKRAFLVHGEPDQAIALRTSMLEDGFRRVEIPAPDDEFTLG